MPKRTNSGCMSGDATARTNGWEASTTRLAVHSAMADPLGGALYHGRSTRRVRYGPFCDGERVKRADLDRGLKIIRKHRQAKPRHRTAFVKH